MMKLVGNFAEWSTNGEEAHVLVILIQHLRTTILGHHPMLGMLVLRIGLYFELWK